MGFYKGGGGQKMTSKVPFRLTFKINLITILKRQNNFLRIKNACEIEKEVF